MPPQPPKPAPENGPTDAGGVDEAPDPNEMVCIKHPDIAALGGPVSRASVDQTWQHLGWSIVTGEEADAHAEAKRIASLTGQPLNTAKAGKDK